jgi:hypothetical protein
MLFTKRVAIQGPVEVRSTAGGVSYTYENVDGKENLPARINALTEERRGDRMTVIEDRFEILLGGNHPDLTSDMVVLDSEAVYGIKRVVPAARLARAVTQLIAERVAI